MPSPARKTVKSKKIGKPAQGLLSLRAYARHRKAQGLDGTTLSAVQKAITDERITTINDGGRWAKIDPAAADADWAANTGERRDHQGVEATARGPKPGTAAAERAAGEKVKRELLELDLERKRGETVNAGDVEAHAFKRGRELRDRILNVPARICAQLAALTDSREVEVLLDTELRTALQEPAADE